MDLIIILCLDNKHYFLGHDLYIALSRENRVPYFMVSSFIIESLLLDSHRAEMTGAERRRAASCDLEIMRFKRTRAPVQVDCCVN